ncbi:hypothetical protein GIB67_001957 [Kingdonia uniflora]|uniref:PH domain-containing protein n=1 Tax=Kingdonia uniflora TaxID=39325 RepID=A0A7J7MGD5_9MAGN|nr:hypothetical protein GIB67_001957 [Kingdonia uniflora]
MFIQVMEDQLDSRPSCPFRRLEDILEDSPASLLPITCAPPETPTESMEFLGRSWSLSSLELCKALTTTSLHSSVLESFAFSSAGNEVLPRGSTTSSSTDNVDIESSPELIEQSGVTEPCENSPMSPRKSGESLAKGEQTNEMLLLHQTLNQDFQQPLNNGPISSLDAALRGAATLKARLQKGCPTPALNPSEEQVEENKATDLPDALNFVSRGGEILKRTRKGDLHWKQVSFRVNSNLQVIAKMKSKHMVGALTKKTIYIVSGVYSDISPWLERENYEASAQRAYFGIKTADRVIEFECKSKHDKQMWTQGIRQMLHYDPNMR